MARNPDGTYDLPLPDVQPGERIASTWANTTMNDIALALENSLDRDGNGGMRAPLLFGDGVVGAPGITWNAETTSGLYRAGLGDMRVSILATDSMRWTQTSVQIWNATDNQWETIVTDGGTGNVTVPAGSSPLQILEWDNSAGEWALGAALEKVPSGTIDGQRLSWDTGSGAWTLAPPPSGGDLPLGTTDGSMMRWETTGSVWQETTASKVQDNSTVVIDQNLNVLGSITVAGTVDGRDIAADGTAQDTHIGTSNIHFTVASINHNSIQNSGTVSHANLDSHVNNATIHFTEGSINHNNILNNGSQTHAQIDSHITSSANIHWADTNSSTPQIRRNNSWFNGVQVENAAGSGSAQPTDLQTLTQAQYDGLGSKDPNTLYFVIPA